LGNQFANVLIYNFLLSKLHMENCFWFATKYFISENYQAGRSFYFIPRKSYILIKTKLFSHIKFNPILVDKVTDLKSIDCWSIGKDLYRETIIKFFLVGSHSYLYSLVIGDKWKLLSSDLFN
jgi:hypothetical protein